jgi:5-(carboxyamino)imidazole ribonucleotide synthase
MPTPAPTTSAPTAPRAHPALGIIGGGQLAKMTAMAALQLGCDIVILERQSHGPAANLATHFLMGDWNDPAAALGLATRVDVVTVENEFVDAASLAALEAEGVAVYPRASTIALVQDKFTQKTRLAEAGLPVPAFAAVATPAEAVETGNRFGWPVVLKARRDGYDGKGNVTLRSAADVEDGWRTLGGDRGRTLYVEAFCHFTMELAIIVTRGRTGEVATYPVVETVQQDHICHIVRAPAAVDVGVAGQVRDAAARALEAIDAVGSFGVECFLTADGRVLINELAPRVHNSGHYTIEACACSQFENHVRAVMGWPLGSTAMRRPAAVMVNLLGTANGLGWPTGVTSAVAVPGAALHLYGKLESRKGRKMGHVTALGDTLAEAEAAAAAAAGALTFGDTQ